MAATLFAILIACAILVIALWKDPLDFFFSFGR
jgi:hypothetical protein